MAIANLFTRRYPRIKVDLRAHQVLHDGQHAAQLHDLSATGAFITGLHPAALLSGSVVLELQLPGVDGSLWVTGRVVRREPRTGQAGVAIEFTHVSDFDRQLITEFVDSTREGRRS